MAKTAGKLFRPVVIETELRELVDTILIASSPNAPEAVLAERRIRQKSLRGNAYLYAVEIRNYLEEKTRVGSEPRLFTLAGDLFLDALEADYSATGPNFFRDHYEGVFGCYCEGDDRTKSIEGPLYCVTLALFKALELARSEEPAPGLAAGPLPAFVPADNGDRMTRVRQCLHLAETMVRNALQQAVDAPKEALPPGLLDYVGLSRENLTSVIRQWGQFLGQVNRDDPEEAFLLSAQNAALQTHYLPLISGMMERHALYLDPERQGVRPAMRHYYDAADLLVGQANMDRESGAYHTAHRRYVRALALFERIHDRTSMAKAHVELARLFIRKGGDGEHIQDSLRKAVSLVVAHRDNLPPGRLPVLDHDTVHAFLESKGYLAEAKAYCETL